MISAHGYHGVNHLYAMVRLDNENRADTEYIATVLWSIGRMLGREEYTIPAYHDYKHPVPQDNRSAQAIMNGLQEKLRKGGAGIGGDGTVLVGGEGDP